MRIDPLGDRAILIRLGDAVDEATHRRVRSVCERLDRRPVPGMIEYVPAFASVAVHFDPSAPGLRQGKEASDPYRRVEAALRHALADLREAEPLADRTVEVPVCYGGEAGPDLEDVARHHGIPPEEVVRLHTGGEYLVHVIGFAPGFPYLGGLDPRIATPRRSSPRTLVPARSVGIGGSQTGIYPIDSPGGWHLIGRTPLRLFTPDEEPPTLLRMGDRVRFRSIPPGELRDLEAAR